MEKRLQLELREAVEQKINEGFIILDRMNGILMGRGSVLIQLVTIGSGVIIKNA